MTPWHVDVGEITRFVRALFRYAASDSYISLRAFDQFDRGVPPKFIRAVRVDGSLEPVIREASVAAEETAQADEPAVFCPPIATFVGQWRTRAADLVCGLTLSVELDEADPDAALVLLSGILGPVTVVVRSGSEWVDPASGEVKPKVHLHWRLSEPTTTAEEHDRLRQARDLAMMLAGGDPTAVPIAHPLRWPGSWNLKRADHPVMARIAVLNESAEIHLDDALEALEMAVDAAGAARRREMPGTATSATPEARLSDVRSAMSAIPNLGEAVHYADWVRLGYAVWRASGGGEDGWTIWDNWSRLSDKYDATETEATWRRIGAAMAGATPPRTVGAGTIFFLAAEAGWTRPHPFQDAPRGAAASDDEPDAGEAKAEAKAETETACPSSDVGDMDLDTPAREWLYDRELVRAYVSVLAGTGGAGKTAYAMTVAASVALGRPLLDGGRVHRAGAVWVINLEDPLDELKRRLRALMLHHGVTQAELAGKMFMDSGRDRTFVVAIRDRGSLIVAPIVAAMVAELKRRGITLLIVDPFVASHEGEENRNEEMAFVMSLWARIAKEANCAIWLIHHFRKGGQAGDAEAIRGAGAIQGAARVMHTLSAMTPEEARAIGVPRDDRGFYVRHDNVKANMAPTAIKADWLRLVSVALGNASLTYPEGDHVQAMESWAPPKMLDGLTWDQIAAILGEIDRGPGGGEYYAMARQARERWAGGVVMRHTGKGTSQATELLNRWHSNGVLTTGEYLSPSLRRSSACVRVDQVKLSEMRQVFEGKADAANFC
jgi:hypothetical protein